MLDIFIWLEAHKEFAYGLAVVLCFLGWQWTPRLVVQKHYHSHSHNHSYFRNPGEGEEVYNEEQAEIQLDAKG